MSTIASQITSLTIVYSIVYSDADQRKHQSSASLAFVRGIHGGPVNSSHKWPVSRKMFPFDDVIMLYNWSDLWKTWCRPEFVNLFIKTEWQFFFTFAQWHALQINDQMTKNYNRHSIIKHIGAWCRSLYIKEFNSVLPSDLNWVRNWQG